MSQQSWPPANLSHNAKDNKALQRHICLFRESSRTMTSQGRSENSDQSGPLHPMLPNADPASTLTNFLKMNSAELESIIVVIFLGVSPISFGFKQFSEDSFIAREKSIETKYESEKH